MLSFLVGMLLGGIITVTIMSVLYISKYGEITESELEMWEEHLKKSSRYTIPSKLIEPYLVKRPDIEEAEEKVIIFGSGSKDDWLLKIYAGGRIVFNDKVKEKNPGELAQRFIQIVEQFKKEEGIYG